MKSYFEEHGILHQISCVKTPQQNGRVERKHRHIINVARALRFQAKLPIEFWGECVLSVGCLINRTHSMVLDGKTPYEFLFGYPPSYNHIKTFECLCYAHHLNRDKDKFASRSKKYVFGGYPFEKKGGRLYDLDRGEYFVSRDVVFVEIEFPYEKTTSRDMESTENKSLNQDFDTVEEHENHRVEVKGEEEQVIADNAESVRNNTDGIVGCDDTEEQLGRGQRKKQPSVRLQDYVTHTFQEIPLKSSSSQSNSSGIPYSITHFVSYNKFSSQHRSFLDSVTIGHKSSIYQR